MDHKNYESDFDLLLDLRDRSGAIQGWPDYDWTAWFYTSNFSRPFVASKRGETLTNCFNDGGKIHVVLKDHGLGPGILKVKFKAELPNAIYPDGKQALVSPQPLDIALATGPGDSASKLDAHLIAPYIKGEKGDDGKDGPKGEDGKDGLSAYEQAVEGGYEGTEQDFTQALANVGDLPASDTIVTTDDVQTITAEKTFNKGVYIKGNGNSVLYIAGVSSVLDYSEIKTTVTQRPIVLQNGHTSSTSGIGIGKVPSEFLDVNGYVKAIGFKTNNGKSSQFLKADGSVDENSYVTSHQLSSQLSGKQATLQSSDDVMVDGSLLYVAERAKYASLIKQFVEAGGGHRIQSGPMPIPGSIPDSRRRTRHYRLPAQF